MTEGERSGGGTDTRRGEAFRLLEAHPDLATPEFWHRLERAVKDLVNGDTEGVCLNRQQDQNEIVVEWEPITKGQKEHWQGTGPG